MRRVPPSPELRRFNGRCQAAYCLLFHIQKVTDFPLSATVERPLLLPRPFPRGKFLVKSRPLTRGAERLGRPLNVESNAPPGNRHATLSLLCYRVGVRGRIPARRTG